MQEVNLVDDDQLHQLSVGPLSTLAGYDIPLLRSANQNLGGLDLLPGQLVVSRQFGHFDAVRLQSLNSNPLDL